MTALYAGLMTGTSADGLDACLVRFPRGRPRVLAHRYRPYDAHLREILQRTMAAPDLASVADLDVELADQATALIRELLDAGSSPASAVRAIGCHGQTVLHRPRGRAPTSIQALDPHRLAVRTGIDVIADFRRADMAAGGEGAPLAPGFHAVAFARSGEHRAVVNIGGMANLTLLPGDRGDIRGFDTGPGNVLLDTWSQRATGQPFDAGGRRAASGTVHAGLLRDCLADPFFDRPPPKSTGREHFNERWLDEHLAANDLAIGDHDADIQATLAEVTAITIARPLLATAGATTRLFVCGGGARNDDLMQRLAQHLPGLRVESTEASGLPPDQVEAAAFAWLARQRLLGRPGNVPSVTGATRPLILGAHIRAPR